jgi:polysaccharide export outer membrane protein
VFGWLVAGLLLTGCESGGSVSRFSDVPGVTVPAGNPPMAGNPAGSPAAVPAGAGTNRIGLEGSEVLSPGEAIKVIYSDTPVPIPAFEDQIRADGTITLDLNQVFTAAGKTRRQLEDEIHERYVPKYYKNLTVQVARQSFARFYYVDGDVKAPGRQVYVTPITVQQAIASAGGFTEFAKRSKITVTRKDGRIFKVDYNKALKHPELDLPVYPEDKVWVPRRIFW